MKYFFFTLVFYFLQIPTSTAKCLCQYKFTGFERQEIFTATSIQCFEVVKSFAKKNLYSAGLCKKTSQANFKWSCGEEKKLENDFLSCDNLEEEFASEAINSVSGLSYYLSTPSHLEFNPLDQKGCFSKKNEQQSDAKLNSSKIELTFKSEEDLKKALSKFVPGRVFDRPTDGWQLVINLPNDNKGLGLFDALFDDYGNDEGNTHGLQLSMSKGLDNEYHVTFEYQTNLYTQRTGTGTSSSDGTYYYDQLFLEDNLAKLLIDNQDKVQAKYFKAGLGWHQLNEEKLGNALLSSAKQQKDWHDLLGRDNAARYNYIGGNGTRQGLYLEGAVGRDDELLRGKKHRVISNIEAGAATSGAESTANHIYSNATITLDYQRNPDSFAYRVGASGSIKKYWKSSPDEVRTRITFEMGKKSYSCGTSLVKNWNKRGAAYVKYDLDSDLLTDIYCRKKLW